MVTRRESSGRESSGEKSKSVGAVRTGTGDYPQDERNRMSKDYAKKLYSSKSWQETRRAYGASKGWLCERCLSRGIYKAGEIVHHKRHLTADNINDPDIALSFNNLELLCRDCHADEHSTGGKKGYKFDKHGNVIKAGE